MKPNTISATKLSDDNAYSKSVSLAVSTENVFQRFDVCSKIRSKNDTKTKLPSIHGTFLLGLWDLIVSIAFGNFNTVADDRPAELSDAS